MPAIPVPRSSGALAGVIPPRASTGIATPPAASRSAATPTGAA